VGLLSQQVNAAEEANQLWDFARKLYDQGQYYQAANEYQRFIFLFPNDPKVPAAELQVGRCYLYTGKSDKAYNQLIRVFKERAAEPAGRQALIEAVMILEKQERYSEAIYWLLRFVEHYPEDETIDAIYYRLAWLYINRGEYEVALATLARIPPGSSLYTEAMSLAQSLEQRPDMAIRSPKLAGALSIVPGAGHLYVGRPGQAAASFVLNALFIGGAIVAFENDSPVLGSILVFFELGWYQGGIRSAMAAAREVNEQFERQYRQELKNRYRLSFGIQPRRDQLAFMLRLEF
jgi:tetratricopeptide (TPR) repeat protein